MTGTAAVLFFDPKGQISQVFNDLQFDPKDIIRFPTGLPGFEGAREFIIYTRPEHEPFHWLVSVGPQKVRFAIINPLLFQGDYDPRIPPQELRELEVKDPKDLLLYVIVTLAPALRDSTANLLGPLFINITRRIGKQIVVDDDRYSVKERILS